MNQGNVEVRVLQETNLTKGIHTWYGVEYSIWYTEAESRQLGGVVVFCREAVGLQVEGAVNFGPNVVSLLLTSGAGQWYVVGA